MSDCIFCSIAEGTIPSKEAHSTDSVYAFHDLNPQAPTHVLVIPRRHIENAHAVRAEDGAVLAEMVEVAGIIAEKEGIDSSGYRLVFNVGDDAGNTVSHLHLHLLGGRKMDWPPG